MLIINADDLGRTKDITDRIFACHKHMRIHSASAMTFMEDSERAAELVAESGLPVGLHLNFTLKFTGKTVKESLRDQHNKIVKYLNARKFNQVLYNPMLRLAFQYVFQAQWDEFCRLYRIAPKRLDGHHHMHLCMNMILSGLYPKGMKIRRNFTFYAGEKNPFNRLYRYLLDQWLTSRFQCTDSFFSMAPIDQERLKRLVLLSRSSDVELMIHPGVNEEYDFLLSPQWESLVSAVEFPASPNLS